MRTKKEREKYASPEVAGGSSEKYPYGLRIHLEKEDLKKLGLGVEGFDIGDNVILQCVAKIDSLSISMSESNKSESVSLQITKVNMEKKGPSHSLRETIKSLKSA